MNAEVRQTPDAEVWAQWEGQVVGGLFPLRRLLGCSSHSAVFLTEYKAKSIADAAIKFVRAEGPPAKALLAQWEAAAALSHPHLVRLFRGGRVQFDGREYAFVAMEHADQTLAGILRHRPLSAEEVRELLVPTLDALTFLHRRNLVHGQLKPSNFLAVGDELKLASDMIGPAGYRDDPERSSYDAPERLEHGATTAGDIWSLGTTLVEALTQRSPTDQRYEMDLPASVPATLVDTVRRCLSPAPASRPSVVELRAEYKAAPSAASTPEPQPPARPTQPESPAPQAQSVSRQAAPSPAATVSRPATPTSTEPPATIVSREAAQSSPATAPSAPEPTVLRPVATSVPEPTVLRQIAPSSPAPTNSREAAPHSTAATASRVTPPAATSVSREVTPPPAPSVSRETTPPAASVVSREITPPSPAAIDSCETTLLESVPTRRLPLPAIAAGGLILIIVWSGISLFMSSPEVDSQSAVVPTPVPPPTPATPSAVAKPATPATQLSRPVSREPTQPSLPAAETSPGVLHEVMPDVPRDIQDKIQGRIYVTVRVLVEPSGNVFAALMENPGPSKYFARLADNASREWQFAPTEEQTDRVWLLTFKFTRDEVSVRATEQ
ncbi:MAG TPA: protein kinase [Steroidobacter sp.]|uniref:serine/threonine protein kinase n=1 Tax=Steroidobacter sp. TaxID=1978227 RepID=UPI002ED8BA34